MAIPRARYSDRCSQIIRQWRLLVLLRRAPRTLSELAKLLDCHQRTVRRDLYALQAVPLPIGNKYPPGKASIRGRSQGDRGIARTCGRSE
jgi:predicted DNA-binding transcriptional regulator YafY